MGVEPTKLLILSQATLPVCPTGYLRKVPDSNWRITTISALAVRCFKPLSQLSLRGTDLIRTDVADFADLRLSHSPTVPFARPQGIEPCPRDLESHWLPIALDVYSAYDLMNRLILSGYSLLRKTRDSNPKYAHHVLPVFKTSSSSSRMPSLCESRWSRTTRA